MLKIDNITKSFGGLRAVNDVSFSVNQGEIVGLIGPNGAGKTTLLNLLCGIYKVDSGSVRFEGNDITNLAPNRICHMGISRTYQIPQPFDALTALSGVTVAVINGKKRENMTLSDAGLDASYFLEFVGLFAKRDTLSRDLTLYELRMLELARALATSPRLLLLDEAMAGLNPGEASKALDMIWSAQEQFGVTILWIEHVMKVIMKAANRLVVLQYGEKIDEGPPEAVMANEQVIQAYLGGSDVND
ncbi:ABC transporter ATP-binding protein [bacterium]|nr:ABC transporter ATP-binding protein [bacterium]